jgi:hypothetical protein
MLFTYRAQQSAVAFVDRSVQERPLNCFWIKAPNLDVVDVAVEWLLRGQRVADADAVYPNTGHCAEHTPRPRNGYAVDEKLHLRQSIMDEKQTNPLIQWHPIAQESYAILIRTDETGLEFWRDRGVNAERRKQISAADKNLERFMRLDQRLPLRRISTNSDNAFDAHPCQRFPAGIGFDLDVTAGGKCNAPDPGVAPSGSTSPDGTSATP